MNMSFASGARRRWSIYSCAVSSAGRIILFVSILAFSLPARSADVGPTTERLTLESAIKRGIDHSFSVRVARSDSAAAHEKYREAQTDRYPTLSLTAKSFFLSDVPKSALPLPPPLPQREFELGSTENYQTDLTLSIPLYTGGRLSNRIGSEKASALAGAEELNLQRQIAAYQSRRHYLNLMALTRLESASLSSLHRLRQIERDIQNLHANGVADSLDLLEVALAVERGKKTVQDQAVARKNSALQLAFALGLQDSIQIEPSEQLPVPETPTDNPQSPEQIDRPELRKLNYLIHRSNAIIGLARSGWLPTVSGFGGYVAGKPNRDFFAKKWNDQFSVGLLMNWEINLGGKTGRTASAAKLSSLSTQIARSRLADDILLQSRTTRNNLESAFSTFLSVQAEYDIAGRRFALAKTQHKEGAMTANRLVELEADLATAERLYQAAIVQFYLAQSDYFYAIGSPALFGGLQ